MPRANKTDKKIGRFSEQVMREAVILVVDHNKSIRRAAMEKGLAFQTLSRYVSAYRRNNLVRLCPNYTINKIFPKVVEDSLQNYIVTCSKMFYGLTLIDCRRLAYEVAIRNNLKISDKWHIEKMATVDWIKGFRKRYPNLSLRTPEGCSLARASGFNKHNVNLFFEKLETVMRRHPSFADGSRLYNLDETGTTTVPAHYKVLAQKGTKQVSKVTSAERGTLVTTCCIVGANGQYLPPIMIFPRVHYKPFMTTGAPDRTLGLANKAGWMNSECFVKVIHHFIKHTLSSKENPTLLLMDNHESHLSLEGLDLCKENGVTILTIPPHCTNKLQPLDVGILKPFHTLYNSAVDSWMMAHPGENFTIYNVASCVGFAYPRAMSPINICAAFKKTGIFPYNRHIFSEEDFMPSLVSERPLPEGERLDTSIIETLEDEVPFIEPESGEESQQPTMSAVRPSTPTVSTETKNSSPFKFISPQEIRGYPKGKTNLKATRRRRGKTMIATDTPEKNEIEQRKANIKIKECAKKKKKNIFLSIKQTIQNDGSSSESDEDVILQDSSDDDESYFKPPSPEPEFILGPLERDPVCGDYVLVEFNLKHKIYYIGKILKTFPESKDYEISFLRKSTKMADRFVIPITPDISIVPMTDIKMILSPPSTTGATQRLKSLLYFDISFHSIDLR